MSPIDFLQSIPEILREPVARWWERAQLSVELREAHASLNDALREELVRVVAASEFAASALIQDPGALAWAVGHLTSQPAHEANAEYERLAATAPTLGGAQELLRRWRRP
jgi:hypothetical protein